jgi:hypothetical protein
MGSRRKLQVTDGRKGGELALSFFAGPPTTREASNSMLGAIRFYSAARTGLVRVPIFSTVTETTLPGARKTGGVR